MINVLEVIWISDEEIRPPGPKMVVCVEPNLGFYFRINSNDNWEPCVPLVKVPDHEFLKWDSFIECSILEIDDYIIRQSLNKSGVVGVVSLEVCASLIDALGYASGARRDRNAIREALERLIR
jgi:hypothetical protein